MRCLREGNLTTEQAILGEIHNRKRRCNMGQERAGEKWRFANTREKYRRRESLRLYSTTRLATVRGQSDRNIRKLRKTIHKKLQRQIYDHLCGKQENGGSLTLRERQFLEEYSKIARKQRKMASGTSPPGKNAKPDVYNPLKEVPNIVLDALNVGMLMMGRKPEVEEERA